MPNGGGSSIGITLLVNKISFELREISEWKGKIQKCLDQIINQHSI